MSPALLYVLLVLAAYRAWRLLALDDVTEPLRRALWPRRIEGEAAPVRAFLWDALKCPWCLGTWVAVGAVAATHAVLGLPAPAIWYLAVPTVVGLLERMER